MASDSQVVLDVDMPQVMIVREKVASASGRWKKMCGALLLVALCTAAAVCFTLNKSQNRPDETDEIRHTLRQISGNAKAAVHLTGHYNPQVSNTSVEWYDNADQSFTAGLTLVGNEILIPRNGLYFVYSQASYQVSCTADPEETEGQVVHMSHAVSRWSNSYGTWKPLLSAMRSACKTTPEEYEMQWYGAIYLGAAFKLEAGDRLRTIMDTKLLSKVESAGGKTFFGAFSL